MEIFQQIGEILFVESCHDEGDQHVYEIRPRQDKRGVDLISDALPFGRL